jgi:hypothetical protein
MSVIQVRHPCLTALCVHAFADLTSLQCLTYSTTPGEFLDSWRLRQSSPGQPRLAW